MTSISTPAASTSCAVSVNCSIKNDNDNLEKEFSLEDPINKGVISANKFKNIIKSKLFNIKVGNIEKLINIANKGIEDINKENSTKIIHYFNFIKNLYDI